MQKTALTQIRHISVRRAVQTRTQRLGDRHIYGCRQDPELGQFCYWSPRPNTKSAVRKSCIQYNDSPLFSALLTLPFLILKPPLLHSYPLPFIFHSPLFVCHSSSPHPFQSSKYLCTYVLPAQTLLSSYLCLPSVLTAIVHQTIECNEMLTPILNLGTVSGNLPSNA